MAGLHFLTMQFPGVQRWLESGRDEELWGLTVLDPATERLEVPPARAYGVGAWHMGYNDIYAHVRQLGVPFGVAWSSSPQESDTARSQVEIMYLMALTAKDAAVSPDWFACLHPALAAVLPNAVYLPAPVHMEPKVEATREDWIGFFVPPTEKKAIFSQLLAVREFQKGHPEAELHTNLSAYRPVLDWLGIKYVLHPWEPRPEYLKLLAKCRVVMHASLAESFGYGAADAMMMDTPAVCSQGMPWTPGAWRAWDANNPSSILPVLAALYAGGRVLAYGDSPRRYLDGVARRQNAVAKVVVEGLLDRAGPKGT